MSRDTSKENSPVTTIRPAVYNSAQTGATIDLANYDSAEIIFTVGTLTDGTHTPKVTESNDNFSTQNDVAAGDLQGTLAALVTLTDQRVTYTGSKRYIRVETTESGTTGCAYAAVVVRARPRKLPTS